MPPSSYWAHGNLVYSQIFKGIPFRLLEPLLCTPLPSTLPWKFQLCLSSQNSALFPFSKQTAVLYWVCPPCATILRVSMQTVRTIVGFTSGVSLFLGISTLCPMLPISILGGKNCFVYFRQLHSSLRWKVRSDTVTVLWLKVDYDNLKLGPSHTTLVSHLVHSHCCSHGGFYMQISLTFYQENIQKPIKVKQNLHNKRPYVYNLDSTMNILSPVYPTFIYKVTLSF